MATERNYRKDIDGLRAIAVLSVVCYHFFPETLPGGFVGVDIFFVISGYLITQILLTGLEANQFNILDFYCKRIRRIFPALLLVLFFTLLLGWFVLLSDEYLQLSKHTLAGALFFSNFQLLSEAGYFDKLSDTKHLLHLWSLAIEEQFYILWPMLLYFLWKLKLNIRKVIFFLIVLSFILCLIISSRNTSQAFYLPHTRFWELAVGGYFSTLNLNIYKKCQYNLFFLGFVYNLRINLIKLRHLFSLLGTLIIGISIFKIDATLEFPSYFALFPVIGATLLIVAGPVSFINKQFLSQKLLVWIGLISYPIYLWHWPILTYMRVVFNQSPPGLIMKLVAILLTFVLSVLTYSLLEKKIRHGKFLDYKSYGLIVLWLILILIAECIQFEKGIPSRERERNNFVSYFDATFPNWNYFYRIDLAKEWRADCAFFDSETYLKFGTLEGGVIDSKPKKSISENCYLRDNRFSKSALVWGDSHAQALAPGITRKLPSNWQFLQVASSGCVASISVTRPSENSQCDMSNYTAMRAVENARPDVVVIAQSSGHNIENMKKISTKLNQMGINKILFMGPTPKWTTELPKIFARSLWVTKPQKTYLGVNTDVIELDSQLKMAFYSMPKNTQYVSVIDLFCDEVGCLTYTGESIRDTLTTWDNSHFTPSASIYLAQNLLIKKIVN